MKKITLGILAHVDAGKTTLSEALLLHSGAITSQGRVDKGSAFLDTDREERQRGITIFSSVADIYYGNTSITKIEIPQNTCIIGKYSFANCSNLLSVYCKPIEPPAFAEQAFANNAQGRKIYVPKKSLETYKKAEYWRYFADDIVGYDF
jgi:hypothetical protein